MSEPYRYACRECGSRTVKKRGLKASAYQYKDNAMVQSNHNTTEQDGPWWYCEQCQDQHNTVIDLKRDKPVSP